MRQPYDESLFEHTKMTFGEHLEELRICLFRSLIGVVIGFLIGLALAGSVVRWIERPLRDAMDEYYVERTKAQITDLYGSVPKDVEEFVNNKRMTYQEVYLERHLLADAMRAVGPLTDARNSPTAAQANSASRSAHDPPDPSTGAAGREPNDETDAGAAGDSAATPAKAEHSPLGVPSSDMVRVRLWQPVESEIRSLNAYEPFMIWLKAAAVVGLVIASPWVFVQIWNFVAAGLYPHEKSYVYIYLPISLGLFLAGAALVFGAVFPPVLKFLLDFNAKMGIDPDPRISEWMSFVLLLPLAFGISFQLPLVMLFLERIGIVPLRSYIEKWRIAILAIFFLSMILTPADPVSMLLMAVPLTILYFGGLALCKWMPRRRSPFGPGYDPA